MARLKKLWNSLRQGPVYIWYGLVVVMVAVVFSAGLVTGSRDTLKALQTELSLRQQIVALQEETIEKGRQLLATRRELLETGRELLEVREGKINDLKETNWALRQWRDALAAQRDAEERLSTLLRQSKCTDL